MTSPLSNHKPHARVARSRSHGIDGVDGAPSTHSHPEPQPDRKCSAGASSSGPLPFVASPPFGLIVVALMTTVVAAMTLTAIGAVVDVAAGVGTVARYGLIGLFGWSVLLTIPALISKLSSSREVDR